MVAWEITSTPKRCSEELTFIPDLHVWPIIIVVNNYYEEDIVIVSLRFILGGDLYYNDYYIYWLSFCLFK